MGHRLSIHRSGEAAMAFRGKREAIWHGLGQEIPEDATFDQVMSLAHLDYTVQLSPIRLMEHPMAPSVEDLKIETHKATTRADTGQVLGVVGSRYHVVQNRDAFRALERIPDLRLDTAGAFGQGERVWLLGEDRGGSFSVRGEEMKSYLLFSNSHDGSQMVTVGFTPTRVVCWNTFSMAMRAGLKNQVAIRHTASWERELHEWERALELNRRFVSQLKEVGEDLALKMLSHSQALELFQELVPGDTDGKTSSRTENMRDDLITLFKSGAGNRGESRWDWLNAAVEYTDFYRSTKGEDKREGRMKAALFGSGVQFKQRAFELVTA